MFCCVCFDFENSMTSCHHYLHDTLPSILAWKREGARNAVFYPVNVVSLSLSVSLPLPLLLKQFFIPINKYWATLRRTQSHILAFVQNSRHLTLASVAHFSKTPKYQISWKFVLLFSSCFTCTDWQMAERSVHLGAPFERENTWMLNKNKQRSSRIFYFFFYFLIYLSVVPPFFFVLRPFFSHFFFILLSISLSVYSFLPIHLSFLLFTSRLFFCSFPCLPFLFSVWPSHLCCWIIY